jgi:hypothetical protein
MTPPLVGVEIQIGGTIKDEEHLKAVVSCLSDLSVWTTKGSVEVSDRRGIEGVILSMGLHGYPPLFNTELLYREEDAAYSLRALGLECCIEFEEVGDLPKAFIAVDKDKTVREWTSATEGMIDIERISQHVADGNIEAIADEIAKVRAEQSDTINPISLGCQALIDRAVVEETRERIKKGA